ncbi:MAG: preprotein translocase subunit SecA [Verrucomicrobiales bacterium]|nr:preprotein translocase subunit SecA [Verrucomicrobiales bacterium]|tara:strand:+ start:1214 stop:4309 length:3096 start_codon:yes stop_codon:yes gene_type:complete
MKWLINKIVGSKNQRELKKLGVIVNKINELEAEFQSLSDDQLKSKTSEWKEKLKSFETDLDTNIEDWKNKEINKLLRPTNDEIKDIEEKSRIRKIDGLEEVYDKQSEYLNEILPQAYAVVKNGARRMVGKSYTVCDQPMEWDMIHFDCQLKGGIALHRGIIAEMATGEGKTLVATLPVYLNALTGRGVHVITVNDYLARRDSEWTGELLKYLGLSIGCIQSQMPPERRRENYNCDVTYGTNSEFGFDYLRDNGMAHSKDSQVQRGHYFAIIDEVDSVLIDEARTPLIISGPTTVSTTKQYDRFKPIINQIVKKQTLLCNETMQEAKSALESQLPDDAGRAMVKVKFGQPKNRQLLRLMEDPENRRIAEKAETALYQDSQKKELFKVKEELYYTIDEKSHDADLTELGRNFLNPDDPDSFVMPDLATEFAEIDGSNSLSDSEKEKQKNELQNKMNAQGEKIHSISQLLKAYCLYERDVDYVVTNNKVVIVDENTGREMPGRRWSDGLHQAVEAKEGVKLEKETQTLATITVQNYFRLYEKLAGMTGTAETEAAEFNDIYGLDVLPIPTNVPVQRIDQNDRIYKTRREKYGAAVQSIKEKHAKGQPVLIGTASVEASETVSKYLKREKIPHSVLNAKYHRQEAEIIQRAGQKGAVTVSTSMAGRGTDIKLGNGVPELGGLSVIATERHESRRIDRQLRGRCARQGDHGESIFYISFEDDLMRNFGAADKMTSMMEKFGLKEGEELSHSWLNKSVQSAQKRVEQRNYTMRKRVLDFDDVMNEQRRIVYGLRNEIILTANPRDLVNKAIDKTIPLKVSEFLEVLDQDEEPDFSGLINWANSNFPIGLKDNDPMIFDEDFGMVASKLTDKIKDLYQIKTNHEEPEHLDGLERSILLGSIDRLWQEHLFSMDSLRESVSLRAQAQKDPLVEYKNEAYKIFKELMDNIDAEVVLSLFRSTTNIEAFKDFLRNLPMNQGRGEVPPSSTTSSAQSQTNNDPELEPQITLPVTRSAPKIGRNEPCSCGSGKKFKQCCGRKA